VILNEEQSMLKDSAAEFCRERAPVAQLRRLRDENSATGFDSDTWQAMVELGWAGIPWAEEFGGLDFGYKGLGVVTMECGRTLAASPLFASIWLAGTAVNLAGSNAQKADLLARLARGELLSALALEEGRRHQPDQIATRAEATPDGYVLSGEKSFVPDGQTADLLLVAARRSNATPHSEGISLFLVPGNSEGVSFTDLKMVDSRKAARVKLDSVKVDVNAVLGGEPREGGEPQQSLERTLDIARIGLAAEMQGALESCFQSTVTYLKEREQFGVPIGSFQGLKHRAADLFTELELSKSVVLEALTALDEERDPAEIASLASLAKARTGDVFKRISREAIQMHGGVGMTDEFDVGFFIKRAAVAEQMLGSARYHRNRYAELAGY